MLSETAMLLQKGVEEKRKGNFSKAIMFYKRAIEIEPDKNIPILYISLAKTQYLVGDMTKCLENYMRALYYQIIEISHLIDVDRLSDFNYQIDILKNFFNTIRHISYAYIKKHDCILDFYQLLEERECFISYDNLYLIIDYLSESYAYELASGGIDCQPKIPEMFFRYKDIDWDELIFIKGLQVAHRTISWNNILSLVIVNQGLKP